MNIDGKTGVLGLLGDPVEHTLSPVIHNELSNILGINNVYVAFHTKPKGLADAVKGAYELNIKGLNCTVPHKNQVIKSLVDIDKGAKAIGAVNTLVRTEGGYKGYNTDMMGLYRELCSYNISLDERKVIILGAGGAARAVAYMCGQYGASQVYILNRTLEKACDIAEDMNTFFNRRIIYPMKLEDYGNLPQDRYIVFQATSIGLAPKNDEVVIEDEAFYNLVDVAIDLIYTPYETRFMKLCRNKGRKAYNGLKMLLYQGVIAYELWNDISVSEAQADMVYRKLLKSFRDNIILIGFMGSGKTTIGQNIAEKYGYRFLDTDKYIEAEAGCSISHIFEEKGEKYFRNLETEALKKLNDTLSHTVISTGGGLPLRSENANELSALGKIYFLEIIRDEVLIRLAGDTSRPLLAGGNAEEKVQELLTYRNPLYKAAADYVIPVSGRSVDDITADIMKTIKNG
jgi:shikimate dehydrogenase